MVIHAGTCAKTGRKREKIHYAFLLSLSYERRLPSGDIPTTACGSVVTNTLHFEERRGAGDQTIR